MSFPKAALFVFLLVLNLAVVGCGTGDTEATPENDPVAAEPEDDPTLDASETEAIPE